MRKLARVAAGRKRIARFVVLASATTAALLITAGTAGAAISHDYASSFGPDGTETTEFLGPGAVAVDDSTHTVYIGVSGEFEIEKFDQAGQPVDFASTPGSNAIGNHEIFFHGSVNEQQMAVDQNSHVLYATSGTSIKAFQANGEPSTFAHGPNPGTSEIGEFAEPLGVATDINGDIYVSDFGSGKVFIYKADGTPITSIETPSPANLAIDSQGNIYLGHFFGNTEKFEPSAFPVTGSTTYTSKGSIDTRNPYSVSVDTTTDSVYIGHEENLVEYNADGSKGNVLTIPPPGELFGSLGAGVDSDTGTLFVSNSVSNRVARFLTHRLPNGTASVQGGQSMPNAELTGTVDPAGFGDVSACKFEYGTTTSYELGSVACDQAPPFTEPTDVSAHLSGLEALVKYHYRIVATGPGGDFQGPDQTFFVDPFTPSVSATSFSGITDTTAVMEAELNPGFGATIYRFQYGTTSDYGTQTLPGSSVGSDGNDHLAKTEVTELEPGTTYHFRVVATNFKGTVYGPDETFTTPAAPSVAAFKGTASGQSGANLTATVTSGLTATKVHFEYGTSTLYGSITAEQALPADNIGHAISATLAGLEAGTTYHFRVVADNEFGTTMSADGTFKTEAAVASNPPVEEKKPVTCKKGFVKKHGKCVKRKKPKHKKKTHHKGARHA